MLELTPSSPLYTIYEKKPSNRGSKLHNHLPLELRMKNEKELIDRQFDRIILTKNL